MGKQLHKKFDDYFIKSIFEKYLLKNLSVNQVLEILKIARSRFFDLLKKFKDDPENFSLEYKRKTKKRLVWN